MGSGPLGSDPKGSARPLPPSLHTHLVFRPKPCTPWRHSLLTTHHAPRTTHHSPLTAHHSPLTTHHSPLTTRHSPLTTHRLPLTTRHSPRHVEHLEKLVVMLSADSAPPPQKATRPRW